MENGNQQPQIKDTNAPENWVDVSSQSNSDVNSPENWVDAHTESHSQSPYDAYKATKPQQEENVPQTEDRAFKPTEKPKEAQPKGVPEPEDIKPSFSFPFDRDLNAVVDSAVGSTWNTFVKPITGKDDKYVDAYLNHINKEHPIATVVGGSAPFIASAAILPESLVPNIWARMSMQFGGVGFLNALGAVRTEESKRSVIEKAQSVAIETGKQAAAGPVFAKAQLLKIAERPFATALAQSGIIFGGVGTLNTGISGVERMVGGDKDIMHAFFGNNVSEAFKQGGVLAVVNLAFHSPYLLKTAIGRGSAAKLSQESGVKIDPDAHPDEVKKQINEATNAIEKQNPKLTQPQIISATVKLPDGTQIHGTSHDDALAKIGMTNKFQNKNLILPSDKYIVTGEDGSVVYRGADKAQADKVLGYTEGKGKLSEVFDTGFTVLNPDGTTKFITREEAKQEPFNLPTGHSHEVQGLNETKFMKEPEPLKIVNPDTLAKVGLGEEGKMNVDLIPGVAEAAEILKKSHAELKEKLAPYDLGKEGKYTAEVLREQLGILARSNDMTEQALASTKKLFDKATKESIIETYTKAERGEKQDTPELQKIYDTLQTMLKDEAQNVRNLGTGKLEEVIENYLPHVWEDPKKAQKILGQIFGRRPLEGPKSFLKKRSINDFQAGIEAGLTPVSWNPVDLTMLKLREMRKYVMAQRVKEALKQQGIRKFVKVGQKAPDGWKKINDNSEDVYKSPLIAVKEAYDEHVFNQLNAVARGLGIDVERAMKFKGLGSKVKDAWGLSKRGSPAEGTIHEDPLLNTSSKTANPGMIKTKFASPMSVLAHEIGHQIDEMFNLKEKFLTNKNIEKELRALADLRYEGKDASKGFKNYVRSGSEKMAVMLEAYIHAPEKFKETAPKVYKAFEDILSRDERLKPLLDIEPSLVLGTNKSEVHAGGNVISGHYYTQADAARIIDNYLSPGLNGKSYLYDMYRGAGNTLNQFQLGLSAFHLGFTSMDATISKFALGINKLSSGDYAGAIKEFGKAPFAPITNIMQGRELLQAWYGKDMGPLTNTIADVMASGGGRAKMDKFYATGAKESMQKALKEGKILTGALKVPYYIVEQVARPIMEYIVPRQKMGVFMDMMKMEMERNPNMSHEEMRGVAQRAWDSVDNRMGQMVYDNLFWNRTVKDLGMASVRSLGWNLGTIRELGGGTKDVIGNVQDIIHGRATKMSYRTAYVMALPIVTGLYGAIYQYLHTGQGPQDLKDYFFPRNGAIDTKGQEARVSFPTYMKDVYHYTQNPVQTVLNKFSPVNNAVIQMLANKDFYGTEIRNTDDPIMQQVLDESKFLGTQFIPFGFRNQKRDTRTSPGSRIEPFIGITPAPYDINMTKAEKEASELNKGHLPVGSRTKEQAQHSQEKSKIRSSFMANKDMEALNQAVERKIISTKEKREILSESKMSNLERLTRHSTVEEVERIMTKANAKEKEELQRILDKKVKGKKQRGTWSQSEEELYARSFDASQ